jgi:hypothetical protein
MVDARSAAIHGMPATAAPPDLRETEAIQKMLA